MNLVASCIVIAYVPALIIGGKVVSTIEEYMHMCNSKPKYAASKNKWIPVGIGEFAQAPIARYRYENALTGYNYEFSDFLLYWDRQTKRGFLLNNLPSIICDAFSKGCDAFDALNLCENEMIANPQFVGLPVLAFITVGHRKVVNHGNYATVTAIVNYKSTKLMDPVEVEEFSFDLDTFSARVKSFPPKSTKYGFSPRNLLDIAYTTFFRFPLCGYYIIGKPGLHLVMCARGPTEGLNPKFQNHPLPEINGRQVVNASYFLVMLHQDYIKDVLNFGPNELPKANCLAYMQSGVCAYYPTETPVLAGFCKYNSCLSWNGKELNNENVNAPQVNECAEKSHLCSQYSTCIDLPTKEFYRCECMPGVTGKYCEIDFDECTSLPQSPCTKHGKCVNTPASYRCECEPGYIGDRCEKNANDCINGPKCVNGKCVLKDGLYQCECEENYGGKLCNVKINECSKLNCEKWSDCIRGPDGKVKCDCPAGYRGKRCEIEIDECKEKAGICNNGKCQNLAGSYKCTCESGFTGAHCDEDIDECVSNPCGEYGVCNDVANGYECDCLSGYGGDNCEKPPNYCENVVCNNGGNCVISVNGHYCDCAQGYTGKFCEMKVDFCTSNELCGEHGSCVSSAHGFQCVCQPGFTGEVCKEFVNKCDKVKCKNGGKCLMLYNNDYSCNCPKGTSGKHCEVVL